MEPSIVFYGGSFNPPHLGHQQIVQNILSYANNHKLNVQVWIVPSAAPAVAQGQLPKTDLAPYEDRLEMCRRAFKGFDDKVFVSDLENDPGKRHYTWDSLQVLPRPPVALVVGGDQYASFDRWYRSFDILNLVDLYVQRRVAYQGESRHEKVKFLEGPQHGASSTGIRAALDVGEVGILEEWLNADVYAWIQQKNLYKSEK